MKLSEQTVSLLKNFASVNQNLLFKTGNKLQTISAQKNILVNAEIPESFPSDFAIYDLNKLLGVMSLFQDPELEVGDKTMKIGGKVNYMFADPTMIVTSSIDTTATVWDLNTMQSKTQIIAHDKEAFDVEFRPGGNDVFASVGNDGSLRIFDLRDMEHSHIVYETPNQENPLVL